MEVLLLNSSLQSIALLDTFESLIWTERYYECGDFEIYSSASPDLLTLVQPDCYLCLAGSESTMIVEGREITTDPEKGNHLTITGRSLESILDRRIIWSQTILSGNLQNAILQLLTDSIINPTDASRKIGNFIFEASTDPVITALTVSAQYTGDNLYTVIQNLCQTNKIGFKVTLTDDNKFKFKLYAGVNRSHDQEIHPYVVFSPKFENVLNSDYIESNKNLKTVTLVAGEGEGSARKMTTSTTTSGAGSGLTRREVFTDANDVSTKTSSGTLSDADYLVQLAEKGTESLLGYTKTTSFNGEVDTTMMYRYGEDFFIGDIVQIINEYGMEAKTRVVELIHSQNSSGVKVYPTFDVAS